MRCLTAVAAVLFYGNITYLTQPRLILSAAKQQALELRLNTSEATECNVEQLASSSTPHGGSEDAVDQGEGLQWPRD